MTVDPAAARRADLERQLDEHDEAHAAAVERLLDLCDAELPELLRAIARHDEGRRIVAYQLNGSTDRRPQSRELAADVVGRACQALSPWVRFIGEESADRSAEALRHRPTRTHHLPGVAANGAEHE